MMVVVVGAVMWMVVRAVGIRTVGMIQLAMVSTVHLTTRTVFYGSIFSFFTIHVYSNSARLISLLDLLCQKTKFVLHLQSLYKIL
jgi:hypothetical protein